MPSLVISISDFMWQFQFYCTFYDLVNVTFILIKIRRYFTMASCRTGYGWKICFIQELLRVILDSHVRPLTLSIVFIVSELSFYFRFPFSVSVTLWGRRGISGKTCYLSCWFGRRLSYCKWHHLIMKPMYTRRWDRLIKITSNGGCRRVERSCKR